jgi:hypothetical protein
MYLKLREYSVSDLLLCYINLVVDQAGLFSIVVSAFILGTGLLKRDSTE